MPENEDASSKTSDGTFEEQKAQCELEKLRIDIEEARAWRGKLLLTLLTPIGSVILFFVGWHSTHQTERRQQNQDLYARAAKQLANRDDATVRLSGVRAIDAYIETSENGPFQILPPSRSETSLREQKKSEAMALVIADLLHENDPAVLGAISEAVKKNPEQSIDPLISENKAAATSFARAAGFYSGLSVLRIRHKASFFEDDWNRITKRGTSHYDDPTIDDLVVITLRTGSPFEATNTYNQRFTSRVFLTTPKNCPFKDLFEHQQLLAMNSALHDFSRRFPPTAKELQAALQRVIDTAAVLERSSYLLADFAQKNESALDAWAKQPHHDLFGAAIVVGRPKEKTIEKLRSLGAFYGAPGQDTNETNPGCKVQPED